MIRKLIFLTVFLSVFFVNASANASGVNMYETPRTLPQSQIVGENGAKFKLTDFKGDFVLAHFWSRYCGPCLKELKSLNNFHNTVKNEGIRLILISPDDEWFDRGEQRQFLKRYGATDLEFYVEEKEKLSSDFGIFTNPHTVVINQKGQEIGRFRGSETWDKPKVIKYVRELKNKYEKNNFSGY